MIEHHKSHFDSAEEAPTLPEDPNEAGEFLIGLWRKRVRDYRQEARVQNDEMTEEQKRTAMDLEMRKRAAEPDFTWLAEMHGSEMGWGQGRIETNYGKAFYFDFSYGYEPDHEPSVFAFYNDTDNYSDCVIISKTEDGWEKQSPAELTSARNKRLAELLGEDY